MTERTCLQRDRRSAGGRAPDLAAATLIALLAAALCLLARPVDARAAVVPAKVIATAFATAKGLHRSLVPSSLNLPFYSLGPDRAGGFFDPDALDYGYLATGADVLIVPLDSGGSGSVFTTLLFTKVRAKPVYVGALESAGGHLDVFIQRGRLIERSPVYLANDPNCCPSAHRNVRYTLRHDRLSKLDEFQTK